MVSFNFSNVTLWLEQAQASQLSSCPCCSQPDCTNCALVLPGPGTHGLFRCYAELTGSCCKVQRQCGQRQEGSFKESNFCIHWCFTEKGENQFLSTLLALGGISAHLRPEMNWLHFCKSHGRWIMAVDELYLFTMAFLCHEVLAKITRSIFPCWQQLLVGIKLWDIKVGWGALYQRLCHTQCFFSFEHTRAQFPETFWTEVN